MAGQTSTPHRKLPRTGGGALHWLRANLFGDWKSAVLTVLSLALIVSILPPLVRWAITDAVWGAVGPDVCRRADGACWAFIHEKYRLILFGRFPYDEQWRPFAGMIVLLGVLAFSCDRRFWRPWLGLVWLGGFAVFFGLLWGGFLGMSFVETRLWGGLTLTLILSFVGIGVSFPVSIVLALGRRSAMPVVRALSVVYIELIRGVPLISLLFMASFMLPLFFPVGVNVNALLRAQIAIILFTSAYLAEIVRGGLQAIPRGQYEAAEALGLGYWLRMRKVILPQAIRTVIPPIVNSFISLFKDTSLVAIVSLTDLMLATRQAIADPNWRAYFIEGYVFIALIYFAFCFFMSKYSQYLERRTQTGHVRAQDMA